MKCNLIIPGVPKSGTSSLHEYLNLHPGIQMSSNKEPGYFSVDAIRKKGPEWYDELFSGADENVRYFGESSTSYAYDSKAMTRIKKAIPAVKLIIIVRNPIDRLFSHYRWMRRQGDEDLSLKEAIHREQELGYNPNRSINGHYNTYVRASKYSKYIPHILDDFGKKNVYLIQSEALKKNALIEMNKCFDFLGLERKAHVPSLLVNKTTAKKIVSYYGLEIITPMFPKYVKSFIRENEICQNLKKTFRNSKIEEVKISKSEISYVEDLLASELKFYNRLFQ